MPKGSNKMDKKSNEQFIIIKAAIDSNKQEMKSNKKDSDDKITKLSE